MLASTSRNRRETVSRTATDRPDWASARWVRLYVGRWLRAPVERSDGTLMERTNGERGAFGGKSKPFSIAAIWA